jgi:hypothetical protein
MTKFHKSQIGISLAWIIYLLVRLNGHWTETKWFLFDQQRMNVDSLKPVEGIDVWMASHGTWMFFGLIFFSGVLIRTLISIWEMKKDAQQDG